MASKGKDDDLEFGLGGDELFPLDNSSRQKGKNPPKGVKGYLKNVVKSAFNLSVKVNKSLYPSVFELAENSKWEDGGGNKFDIKKTIDKYAKTIKDVAHGAADIGKEIANDAKTAIKTGYFVKSEEEEMDLGDAFGDMMGDDFGDFGDFGDDSGSDDFGDFDDDLDDGGSKKKKGRLSTSDAIVRAEAASTKATLKASSRQVAATIGSAQSQIKHETALFAQQLQVDQERHFQKMRVLKNIATNIATTVKQNNLSIKAQMEYSAKSLAFAQDTAAMLKEIRDAQWALTKPEEKDTRIQDSKWKKILGNGGINIGEWLGHTKNNFKSNAFGGAFGMLDMVKDSFNMMSDMGMSKSAILKQMVGSTILENIVKGSLSGDTLDKIDRFNLGVQGLPGALNAKLGKLASGNTKDIENIQKQLTGWIGGVLKKRGSGKDGTIISKGLKKLQDKIGSNSLTDFAQKFAENAYIEQQVEYSSDRFKMGDPNKVHPFDNKAHKVLTEIIPAYLRKISAGVNHTGEEVFDFKSNKFVPLKAVQSEINERQKDALLGLRGIDETREGFSFNIDNSKNKNTKINKQKIKDSFNNMYEGWLERGHTLDLDDLESAIPIKEGNDYKLTPSSHDLFSKCDNLNNEEKYEAAKQFYNYMKQKTDASKNNHVEAGDLIEQKTAAFGFKSSKTQNNLTIEEDINSRYGDSSIYESHINQKANAVNIKQLQAQIERCKKKKNNILDEIKKNRDNDKDGKNTLLKAKLNRTQTELEGYQHQLASLSRSSSLNVEDTNSSNFADMEQSFLNGKGNGFEKFRMASVEDSSTHGLVQNIYNLLLSGIDVYTTPKENEPKDRRKYISNVKRKLAGKYGHKIATEQEELQKAKLTACTNSETFDGFLKDNSIDANYKNKLYYFENHKMQSISLQDLASSYDPKTTYYFNTSEKEAFDRKENRNEKKSWNTDGGLLNNKFLGPFAKIFDKFQNVKSSIGNSILAPIFGIEGDNAIFGDIKSKANSLKDKAKTSSNSFIMNQVKKNMDSKLFKMKPEKSMRGLHSNLAEAIAAIEDPEFQRKLNNIKDPVTKAGYLKAQADNHDSLKPFVVPLEEYLTKGKDFSKNRNSALGYVQSRLSTLGNKLKDKLGGRALAKYKAIKGVKTMNSLMSSTQKIGDMQITFAEAIDNYEKERDRKGGEPTVLDKLNEMAADKTEKDPTARNKKVMEYFKSLATENSDAANKWLAPFLPNIEAALAKNEKTGDLSVNGIKDAVVNKIKGIGSNILDKIKKRIFGDDSDPKKLIPSDMMELTGTDGSKLGDKIVQIAKDNGILPILTNLPTGIAKAKYLQTLKVEGLENFKPALGEYISNKGQNLKDKVKGGLNKLKGTLFGVKDKFFDKAGELKDKAKNKFEEVKDRVTDKAHSMQEAYFAKKLKDEEKEKKNDLVKGNSAEEQRQAKIDAEKDKREKENSEALQTMASTLKDMKNGGIALDDETKKEMGETVAAAASSGGEGTLGFIDKILDKTGLKNTKVGQTVSKVTGPLKNVFGALKSSKVGSAVSSGVTAIAGKLGLGAVSSAATGAASAAATAGSAAAAAGAAGAGGVAAGGAAGAGIGIVKTLLGKICKIPKIVKHAGSAGVNALKNAIVKGLEKFAPKLASKLATASLPAIGQVIWITSIVASFTKGLVKAKTYFKVGAGQRISAGMRLCSGLANCIDGALFGIPGLIASFMGAPNVAVWLFDKIGRDADKAVIERYRRFNEKRALIYGIQDPDALSAFENRQYIAGDSAGATAVKGIGKALRWLGNKLTLGLVKSNDQKDAETLGFKTEKIFKYWKEKKFKPLDDLRKKIAEDMGLTLKDVDESVLFDPTDAKDEDEDGEIDDSDSKAAIAQQKIELQQEYRVKYLEAARSFVLDSKLAWLTNRTTPEDFKKYSGEEAGGELKGAGGRMKETITNMWKSSPAGKVVDTIAKAGSAFKQGYSSGGFKEGLKAAGQSIKQSFVNSKLFSSNEWMQKIFKRYSITDSNKAESTLSEAGQAIHDINATADPSFYSSVPEKPVGASGYGMPANVQQMVQADSNGAIEGGKSGGFYMITKDGKEKELPSNNTEKDSRKQSTVSKSQFKDDGFYDLSGKTPKAKVMNSIIEDLSKRIGDQIIEKLNILEEMHKENLRYHGVAEEFFTAALKMMATIASASGNTGISSRLDSMIGEIVR